MKTNQHADSLLTSTQNQYSVRHLRKNFTKQILLAYYVLVPDSAEVEKECIYVLLADSQTFHQAISFFYLRDLPSQDVEGIFSQALPGDF